jgi:hypothetical protein
MVLPVEISTCLVYLSVSMSFCLSVYLPINTIKTYFFFRQLIGERRSTSGISLCLSVSLSVCLSVLSMFVFKLSFSFSGSSLAKGDQHLVEHEADRRAEGVRPHLRPQRLGKLLRFVIENFSL